MGGGSEAPGGLTHTPPRKDLRAGKLAGAGGMRTLVPTTLGSYRNLPSIDPAAFLLSLFPSLLIHVNVIPHFSLSLSPSFTLACYPPCGELFPVSHPHPGQLKVLGKTGPGHIVSLSVLVHERQVGVAVIRLHFFRFSLDVHSPTVLLISQTSNLPT